MLVLKNLEQITLSDITKEAKEKQKAEWGNTKWYKRGLQMIATIGMKPEHRTAELEKELLAKSKSQSLDTPDAIHRNAKTLAYIESLAKVAAEGPDVTIENGELRINYVSLKDLAPSTEGGSVTMEQQRALEDFNRAATAYAKIPHERTHEDEKPEGALLRAATDSAQALGLGRRRFLDVDSLQYKSTKRDYETARASLLYVYKDKFKAEDGLSRRAEWRAMCAMNKLDERVALNQLFNTNPDAEAALQSIEDTSAMKRAAKEFWKSKGMFIAYGAATPRLARLPEVSQTLASPMLL